MDFDGTLVEYDFYRGPAHIGPVIPAMLARILRWLELGWEVRIFTARANDPGAVYAIQHWCPTVGLPILRVTNTKDYQMAELWDDIAIQVRKNTGQPCPCCQVPEA